MVSRGLLVASVVFLTVPFSTSAQAFLNTDPYTVSISPQFPAPLSQVVLTPTSGSVDLTKATMRVFVDAKQIYEGNAQPVSARLGAAGTLTTIKVVVTAGGTEYPKTIALRPQDVVLIVEPVASAPALYPGKPLVPLEGSVRVVAMANLRDAKGVSLNPATLSYSWVVDTTRIAASSGIGKDTILVASPLEYRSRDVSVTVQSQDGTSVGGAALSLTPQAPTIRLYESDPLLGVLFDRALSGSFAIASGEKTLYGAAYSFPLQRGAPLLRWFLNGSSAQTGSTITLRPAGSGTGTAALSLVGSAGESTTATQKLSVSFGAAKGIFGIFGL